MHQEIQTPAPSRLTIPVPEGVEKPVSPKIEKLVSEITTLNLLEVSELSQVLKKRLNLPDTPLMPVGGFAAAAPAAAIEEEEVAPKTVKTSFTVSIFLSKRSSGFIIIVFLEDISAYLISISSDGKR